MTVSKSLLANILINPENVDGVFSKIITKNDDSGRHGVLIPTSAYAMFPEISDFRPTVPQNYTEKITTLFRENETVLAKASSYKHYHRYPERRITALHSKKLDNAPTNTLIVVARRNDVPTGYEIHVFYPSEPEFSLLCSEFNFPDVQPGLFYLDKDWSLNETIKQSAGLLELLDMFDGIKAKGYIRTMRAGPTGVGYTFETLMEIKENNDGWADFKGIEIKTFRSKELKLTGADKTNLFLKEPRWKDGLKNMAERVRQYGYIDDEGRHALYSTVKIRQNSHGLKFEIMHVKDEIDIQRYTVPIAFYGFEDISKRLREKHTETAFVAALHKGAGVNEEFHYGTLTYCLNPDVNAFNSLIETGDVMLELRMHIKSNGTVRNHGSAFRITKNKLPDLFKKVVCLRDAG
jgi:hypothetical protein